MADVESVSAARKRVATAYNTWLGKSFRTKLSESGLRAKRDEFPRIGEDGTWAENQGKAPAWIIALDRRDGVWTASLPVWNHAKRVSGGINGKSQLQGLVVRVIPVAKFLPGAYYAHPYWEWALVFVAPDKLKSLELISSGGVFVFDPATGALTAQSRRDENKNVKIISEPYVQAALFKLVPGDDPWNGPDGITYDEATNAIARFLNVDPLPPPEPSADAPDA